jgi:hypothetical protein
VVETVNSKHATLKQFVATAMVFALKETANQVDEWQCRTQRDEELVQTVVRSGGRATPQEQCEGSGEKEENSDSTTPEILPYRLEEEGKVASSG